MKQELKEYLVTCDWCHYKEIDRLVDDTVIVPVGWDYISRTDSHICPECKQHRQEISVLGKPVDK